MTPQIFSFLLAIGLTLTGVWMQWHLPRHRMSMEEAVKDEHMTPEAARRRQQIFRVLSLVCSGAGLAILLAAMLFLGP